MRSVLPVCAACALAVLGLSAGCVEFEPAAGAAVKGRAYFVRHTSSSNSELWVCDASAGRPVCFAAAANPGATTASY